MDPKQFRLVVVSGPTREWMDPVRFISNPSTGRTGHAIAAAGLGRFHEVVFISGPVDKAYRTVKGAKNRAVETTDEMLSAVNESIAASTVLVMAAAPADYKPAQTSSLKLKKKEEALVLQLEPTPDILKTIKQIAHTVPNLIRVGFAAETDHLSENARKKLDAKGLDLICANLVFQTQKGFGENDNELLLFFRHGAEMRLGPASKEDLAQQLLDCIIQNF